MTVDAGVCSKHGVYVGTSCPICNIRREDGLDRMKACLRAYKAVRGGRWIRGAVTHVIPEFLDALRAEGWQLVKFTPEPEETPDV